jgi:hypothetical protein
MAGPAGPDGVEERGSRTAPKMVMAPDVGGAVVRDGIALWKKGLSPVVRQNLVQARTAGERTMVLNALRIALRADMLYAGSLASATAASLSTLAAQQDDRRSVGRRG